MDEYGQFEAGQQSGELEQVHQTAGSESDYDSQFGVYGADHAEAESTDFETGRHVEFEGADGSRYESTDFTNYSSDSESSDSVFAAQGSESSHTAQFSQLDALRSQFDTSFARGTELSLGDGDGHNHSIASN